MIFGGDLIELRVWHYRRAISQRTLEAEHRAIAESWEAEHPDIKKGCRWNRAQARNAARRADFEEAAVRAPDTVVPGKAEDDDKLYPRVK